MKIAFATYIDNQQEIEYPINYILSKIPDLNVYCSDEQNQAYLKSQGVEADIIGVKIKQPVDISVAQNACVSNVFETLNPDFVVWVQADIHILPIGHKLIEEFCCEENLDKTQALGLMHIKLFHHCGFSYYGVNIIGKNAWERIKFTGDGAYLGQGGADYCSKEHSTVDIGYLTIDQCRRHLKKHKDTWNSTDNVSDLPDNEFVNEVIRRSNYEGLLKEGTEEYELIKDMGLMEEYNKVKALC